MFKWRTEYIYLARYLGSGSVNTIAGFAVIFLLMWIGVSPFLANVTGYAVGLIFGFVLSKRFVFRSQGNFLNESIRYVIAFVISFLFNLLILRVSLNVLGINMYMAQLAAAGSYTLSMYLLIRLFVFILPVH